MDRTEYDAIEAVNWSTLRELLKSPAAYRHRTTTTRQDSDAFRLGRAFHTRTLEPHKFADEFVVWGGGRRYGKEWDAFATAQRGRATTILTVEQMGTAQAMAAAVTQHPAAARYLDGIRAEVSMVWTDPRTGVRLKGRADGVGLALLDLKSTRGSCGPKAFARTVAEYHLHGQLALYRQGLAATGIASADIPCILIAVETEPPHDVAVYKLDEDTLWRGDQLVAHLLDRLVECRASDQWPGACPDEQTLELPGWYRQPNEDEDETDAEWLMGVASNA